MKASNTTKANRYSWIDYARGIAIMLVVYRHSFEGIKRAGLSDKTYMFLEYANIFFFSFRMPLFFIVSGVFVSASLAKRGLWTFFITKCKTILYPYFVWGFLQVTLQIFFSKYSNAHKGISNYLDLLYLPREVEQFWYLYALFNVTVLYAFLKSKLKLTTLPQLLLGVVLYYVADYNAQHHIDLTFVNDICHYYLFFAAGDAVSKIVLDKKNLPLFSSFTPFLVLLPFFIVAQIYFVTTNLNHSSEKYEYVEYFQPFIYVLIALVGCAFTVNVAFILQRKNAAVWLRRIGFYSLYIYVAHVMVTASTRIVISKLLHIKNVPLILAICIVFGILVPILLYKLAERLNARWLFTLQEKDPKAVPKKIENSSFGVEL